MLQVRDGSSITSSFIMAPYDNINNNNNNNNNNIRQLRQQKYQHYNEQVNILHNSQLYHLIINILSKLLINSLDYIELKDFLYILFEAGKLLFP